MIKIPCPGCRCTPPLLPQPPLPPHPARSPTTKTVSHTKTNINRHTLPQPSRPSRAHLGPPTPPHPISCSAPFSTSGGGGWIIISLRVYEPNNVSKWDSNPPQSRSHGFCSNWLLVPLVIPLVTSPPQVSSSHTGLLAVASINYLCF